MKSNALQGNFRPPIERMMKIALELRLRKRFNTRTLAEELEVSQKSVQRDLDFMRDRLGYEIVWKQEGPKEEWSYVGQPPKERVL